MSLSIIQLGFFICYLAFLSANKLQPCIFEYNSSLISQGEVYSPNYPDPYPNNLNCRYEFYARENERVILRIEDFQLEAPQSSANNEINFMDFIETITRSSPAKKEPITSSVIDENSPNDDNSNLNRQCFYDFLDVFTSDGQGRLYWRSRHCGNQIDEQIVSTSPTLILVFQSDRMLGFRGFKFHFHFSYLNILPFVTDPICGASEIVGNGSILASPNYPLMFPSNTECAWTITVEKHQNVLVKFIDVNLNQPCQQSQVAIWDGYVSDITKPDFIVCEKLTYYHKGILQYKSKTNRLVIKFLGNKIIDKTNRNLLNENTQNSKLEDLIKRQNRTNKQKIPKIKNGFFLSWTGIHLATDCGTDFQCKGGEYCIDSKNFLCQQTYRYCISKKLVCDGVYNCDTGDESDEKHCELSFLQSKLYLSLAIIGTFIFILLTLIFFIFYKINKKNIKNGKKTKLDRNDTNNSKLIQLPNFIEYNEKSLSSKDNLDFKLEYRGLTKSPPKSTLNSTINSYQQSNTSNSELDDDKLNYKEINQLPTHIYPTNSNEESNLLSNKNSEYNMSNRNSTPTGSSSLPSETLPTTPTEIPENKPNNITIVLSSQSKHTYRSINNMNKSAVLDNGNRDKKNKLGPIDDDSKTLRRNSYTKAIFFENG